MDAALRSRSRFPRKCGCAFFGHDLIDNRRGTRRIPLEASGFETRDRFHEAVFKLVREKVLQGGDHYCAAIRFLP